MVDVEFLNGSKPCLRRVLLQRVGSYDNAGTGADDLLRDVYPSVQAAVDAVS